ncbi:hypothetical protein H072_2484 [Dactylellina haptotyla CBS 200.50]|uniref:C2H2-type domain-containing protein n=1 Tax=Dactylellina haptotyla (strain CBS 200.50) TaxID=1284197 RepID=S8BVN4_DACHA|nr:hypothetical protein H072_2484 [Dactylellina haptotyla CBS 200.50]
MSHIHMDYLLTADADIDEHSFESSIRRLSVGSSATNASSHGPPTPSPSMSATTSFTGETVSPSLLLSSEYPEMTIDKPYSASMLAYGHNPYLSAEYPVLSSVHQEYIRPSTIESFPTSATMSPLSISSFYHSPASSFGSDSTFDEGHDAAAIAVARAAMPGLLHDEDVDEDHLPSVVSPSYLSMLSPKSKGIATLRNPMKKPQTTDILTPHQNGVAKRRQKRNYPEYIPGQDTKPHKCLAKGCNARFKRQEHLKRHERTHTGEKPFYCDVSPDCGRYFSRSDNLRQHKKTHYQFNPRGRNKFVGNQTDLCSL